MKQLKIVSLIMILLASVLYYFGYCDWDLYLYVACIAAVVISLFAYHRVDKHYEELKQKSQQFKTL